MLKIKVKYKDKVFEYDKKTTLNVIKEDVKKDYKYPILLGSIDNIPLSLSNEINKNCIVDFYDYTSKIGNNAYKKGLIFIFIKAVKDVLNCDVKITYLIDKTIYCNILSNNVISEVTVEKIKIRMKEIIDSKIPISKIIVSRLEAIDYYNKVNQIDKAKELRYISNSNISLYRLDDCLDYFYNTLPYNTGLINEFNLKFIGDNMVALLCPYLYSIKDELRFEKNEKIIKLIKENDRILNNLNINTSTEVNEIISKGNYEELVLISESIQNNKLINIASKIKKDNSIKMVLITGPSSSGKTTTSKKLSTYLRSMGKNPVAISVDDFYMDIDKRKLNSKGKPEMENISAIDVTLFNKVISELLNGNEVLMPKFDFNIGKTKISKNKLKIKEDDILIIEGIHAFNDELTEMIPDKNKFKIFISPVTPLNIDNHNYFDSNDVRLLRRIVRDNKRRSFSVIDSLKIWNDVRISEEKNILPYIKEADEIFNTYLIYELNVLKTYVEPLLFSVEETDENYSEALRLINLFRLILSMPSDFVPKDSIIREFIGESCYNE